MATVTIEVDQAALDKYFDKLTKKLTNFEDVWPEVIREFFRIEEDQFESLGHGKWQPLNPTYAKWKAQHYPGQPLMVREGRLKAGLTGGASTEKRPLSLTIAAKGAEYWKFHQRGTRVLPVRKVIDMTPDAKRRLAKVFIEEAIKGLK